MSSINYAEVEKFISEHVLQIFYDNRINRLKKLRLQKDILHKKNPYLFRAKNIQTAEGFVKSALDAFLISQEETMFGNLMEDLAVYVCEIAFGGKKAKQGEMKSVDLEFERDNNYYIVGIKSGTNWGNKDQLDRMKMNFKSAIRKLKTDGITKNIVAVNGCIYGQDSQPFKENKDDPEQSYYKYAGQEFWSLISGDDNLYVRLIEPLGVEAKKRDPSFQELYTSVVNEMTLEFGQNFLLNGQIDWEKIITFVSKKKG